MNNTQCKLNKIDTQVATLSTQVNNILERITPISYLASPAMVATTPGSLLINSEMEVTGTTTTHNIVCDSIIIGGVTGYGPTGPSGYGYTGQMGPTGFGYTGAGPTGQMGATGIGYTGATGASSSSSGLTIVYGGTNSGSANTNYYLNAMLSPGSGVGDSFNIGRMVSIPCNGYITNLTFRAISSMTSNTSILATTYNSTVSRIAFGQSSSTLANTTLSANITNPSSPFASSNSNIAVSAGDLLGIQCNFTGATEFVMLWGTITITSS